MGDNQIMDYWQKQSHEKPLFEELTWDKPERKDQAGKLLIVGGNVHGFAAPAKAFEYANQAGIGNARICLPDSLRRTLHTFWTDAIFCPSTPSGSFAQDSRELILNNSLWSDGIIFPGDLGRNSETAIMLDELMASLTLPIAITKDALDYFLPRPKLLFDRPDTLVVASFSELQKLCSTYGMATPLTFTMSLVNLIEALHALTQKIPASIITKFNDKFIVAVAGFISTTDAPADEEIWRLEIASKAIVNWLHFPNKQFEALTHSVLISS